MLAHKLPDGSERPVGYVSRTLNDAERNYAQLEKEGLALVFGVKKFYSYLFGHAFTLITDHKPLLGLLSECKSTSPQASARVKRWSLYLVFRNTTAHANADALSRLPAVIEACRERFAQFGLPETIVTDNGTCFVSSEFEMFLTKNGIKHITTAPYHPASNGLAERSVQIVKNGLKRDQHGTFRSRLSRVLANYRLKPLQESCRVNYCLDDVPARDWISSDRIPLT